MRRPILAGAVLLVAAGIAPTALADHAVHVDGLSKVIVDDRVKVNRRGPSEVSTYRITLQPGAATPWHYHPGPHLVSIASGTVTVYEADCSTDIYPEGTGFFDPGKSWPPQRRHVHTARNDGDSPAVLVVTDIREPGELLRVDVPPPASCF